MAVLKLNSKLVSVIVPTYRRHVYLELTVKSILNQSYSNLELIVVSDGDDPKTRELVESQNDSRVKYAYVTHAGFPAVPRNEGLRQAKGDLLAFCDDDDIWHQDKLRKQVSQLEVGNISLCTTDFEFINEDGLTLSKGNFTAKYHGNFDWTALYSSMGFICNSAGIFTRSAYERVGDLNEDPALRANEDFEYWIRILRTGPGYFVAEKLVSYRIHQGSIQRTAPSKTLKNRLYLHEVLRRRYTIPRIIYLKKIAKIYCHYLFDCFPLIEKSVRKFQ